jgi:hypothetical protein
MLMIRMLENGYVATDTHGKVLFEENADHSLFFHFLEADTSSITQDLLKYISSVIDTRSMEVREGKSNLAALNRAKKALKSLHPFLSHHETYSIAPEMLAYHLNLGLLQPRFRDTEYSEEWYGVRLRLLVGDQLKEIALKPLTERPYYPPNKAYLEDVFVKTFYDRYLETRENGQINQTAIQGIRYATYLQNKVKHHVYWLIDASAKHFTGMTLEQRSRLYSNLFAFDRDLSSLTIVQRTAFSNPYKNKAKIIEKMTKQFDDILSAVENATVEQVLPSIDEQNERQRYDLETSKLLAGVRDNSIDLAPDLHRDLQRAIDQAKAESDEALFEEYEVETLYQLLLLEMKQIMKSEAIVKRCRLCSRYFTTTNKNIDYCNNVMEGETQPCSEIGSTRAFLKKLDADYPLKIYNRAYKTHYARKTNGLMTDDQFTAWRDEAKERLELARAGRLDVTEFEVWLKN